MGQGESCSVSSLAAPQSPLLCRPRSAEAKAGTTMQGCRSVPSPLLSITCSGKERREESLFRGFFSCSCSSFFPFWTYEIKGMNSSKRGTKTFRWEHLHVLGIGSDGEEGLKMPVKKEAENSEGKRSSFSSAVTELGKLLPVVSLTSRATSCLPALRLVL